MPSEVSTPRTPGACGASDAKACVVHAPEFLSSSVFPLFLDAEGNAFGEQLNAILGFAISQDADISSKWLNAILELPRG
jgi:hypothetical protein